MGNIRQRCKRDNIECNITKEYLLKLYYEQNGCCMVTGKPFDLRSRIADNSYASPWAMSVDRLIGKEGYIENNIRLVCVMSNMCKGRWTDEEVYDFCHSVIENKV